MECPGNFRGWGHPLVVVRACGDASGSGSAFGSLWVREWSGRALDTAPISRG